LKLGKFLNSNKGFFLLALAAAIFGLVATFLFGGCSKNAEQSRVIVSKRVKIAVKDIPGSPAATKPDKKLKAGEKKPWVWEGGKKPVKGREKHKTRLAKKTGARPRPKARAKTSAKPLKTLRKSWAVNVASFTRSSDAERLKKRLAAAGYNVYITQFRKGGILYYRVRVGFYVSRDRARKKGKAIVSAFRNVGSPWVTKPGMDEIMSHTR